MRRGNVIANLDWLTILIFLVLITIGWLNIYSAVYSEQHPNILDFSQRYGQQFIWIIAAIFIAIVILLIDFRFFEFFGYIIYGFAIFLLLFVIVAGKEINGAKSWISIASFQIQPSEFAKPAVALALAKYLSTINLNLHKTTTYLKTAFFIFLPALLILMQPDTGSALVFSAFILVLYREGFPSSIILILLGLVIVFMMVLLLNELLILAIILGIGFIAYWVMTESFKKFLWLIFYYLIGYIFIFGLYYLIKGETAYYLSGILSALIGIMVFSIIIYLKRIRKVFFILLTLASALFIMLSVNYVFDNFLSKYQQHRVNIMLGIESDPLGAGYNLNQSKIAIGSGGFTGKGYLKGTQTKLRFVPEQSTDFIFCTMGEELGFIGSTVIIVLFLVLFYRLIYLAERQRNYFARIYGYGVVSILFFHFAINIAMTIGLFPVIGIPLPFFSYGGSSLWAFTILLFIFLRFDASRTDFI